eukprot:Gb_12115 [translate_table: standard]
MRGGCIANIGSCGTGFDSASGSVRTNRFRAEGLELADREGEKNKAVPTAESIRCSSMDEALSFASRAKCDERLVFSSLCALSREPLFRERLAPLLREAKLIFPPLLGSSSAAGLRLLRKVRFLPNSVREGTKKEYDGTKDQGEKEECTKSKVKHQTRVVVSRCIFAFMVCSIITSSGGISLGIRWGRIHSSHFVKWGPTVSISLRVVPLPYHSFYFNKESRSVAKNGNYSGPGQLLVEGAARSSSGGQTLICCFTPSWAANYKLFPTGRRDAMIHVVVKQEMPGRSKIGPSHNTPAAVATMKKENDDPSPQPTMTHLSAAHRTTNNQVGHTQAWNNTPPDPWSADASGNWIIIEFGRSHPRSSTSHPERYTIGIYRSYRQLSEKLKSSIMGVPSVLSNPYVQSFLIEGSIRHVAFSSKQGSKSKNPPHSIENPCWIPQPVLFKMRSTFYGYLEYPERAILWAQLKANLCIPRTCKPPPANQRIFDLDLDQPTFPSISRLGILKMEYTYFIEWNDGIEKSVGDKTPTFGIEFCRLRPARKKPSAPLEEEAGPRKSLFGPTMTRPPEQLSRVNGEHDLPVSTPQLLNSTSVEDGAVMISKRNSGIIGASTEASIDYRREQPAVLIKMASNAAYKRVSSPTSKSGSANRPPTRKSRYEMNNYEKSGQELREHCVVPLLRVHPRLLRVHGMIMMEGFSLYSASITEPKCYFINGLRGSSQWSIFDQGEAIISFPLPWRAGLAILLSSGPARRVRVTFRVPIQELEAGDHTNAICRYSLGLPLSTFGKGITFAATSICYLAQSKHPW